MILSCFVSLLTPLSRINKRKKFLKGDPNCIPHEEKQKLTGKRQHIKKKTFKINNIYSDKEYINTMK